ncbi:hypothetical protein SAMN05661099_3396 [Daejeonella lutea]|uniref:Uncharacterized protein n=1 Tax=Daejeonella lutea TaxID=572036 RepID=A0A1T5F4F7_9SPHI|nr:hypothetical protein SAMN05661099_3396 [Daejeonella lutea]
MLCNGHLQQKDDERILILASSTNVILTQVLVYSGAHENVQFFADDKSD